MQFRECFLESLFAVRLTNTFAWEHMYGIALKYKSIIFDLTLARSCTTNWQDELRDLFATDH